VIGINRQVVPVSVATARQRVVSVSMVSRAPRVRVISRANMRRLRANPNVCAPGTAEGQQKVAVATALSEILWQPML
jgi:hypothetical protein